MKRAIRTYQKYYNIFIYIYLFSFLEPDLFKELFIIHNLMVIIRLISTTILIYVYIKEKRFDKFTILFLTYFMVMFLITIFKGGEIVYSISSSIPIIGLILLVKKMFDENGNTLAVLNVVFSSLVYINLLHILLFDPFVKESSANAIYFLGNRNQLAPIIFPALAISYANSITKFGKLNYQAISVILAVILTVVMTKSATAFVGVLLIVLYFLIFHGRKNIKYINYKNILLVISFVFVFIVLLRQQDMFAIFIEGVLGKDLTFSTRTAIWDRSLDMIKENICFGYGEIGTPRFIVFSDIRRRDAHNIYLQLLLRGGLSLLVMYIANLIYSIKSSKIINDSRAFVLYIILVMHILMMMEVYNLNTIFLLFLVSYILDRDSVFQGQKYVI